MSDQVVETISKRKAKALLNGPPELRLSVILQAAADADLVGIPVELLHDPDQYPGEVWIRIRDLDVDEGPDGISASLSPTARERVAERRAALAALAGVKSA